MTDSSENREHVNLTELQTEFSNFDNLMTADDDSSMLKKFHLFNLLVSIAPRGHKFSGRHGTGLMTKAEFTKVVETAYDSGSLEHVA